jgi:SulP family sulfate permease
VLPVVAVEALGLASHHGVVVLGHIQEGLPQFGLPSASGGQVRHLIGPVVTVAFVCVAQTASTVRSSSAGAPADEDFNRDLMAVGAGSVVAGFLGARAVDASPPNSSIVAASGGCSQLTGVVAAGIVGVVVLAAPAPLAHLPAATLGATLVFVPRSCSASASCAGSSASTASISCSPPLPCSWSLGGHRAGGGGGGGGRPVAG